MLNGFRIRNNEKRHHRNWNGFGFTVEEEMKGARNGFGAGMGKWNDGAVDVNRLPKAVDWRKPSKTTCNHL
jgi:hypothetical protein